MYLGWRSGADEDESVLRLRKPGTTDAFALMQDDVMGRRRRCAAADRAAHIQFAGRHRDTGNAGMLEPVPGIGRHASGRSLSVWRVIPNAQEQGRTGSPGNECGPATTRCVPNWQSDSSPTSSATQMFPDVRRRARRLTRKSGNYTVRRPLERSAPMAGVYAAGEISALGRYEPAVGEAFQLRDATPGVSGVPAVTTAESVGTDPRPEAISGCRRPPDG